MQQSLILKPQDVALLAKTCSRTDKNWRQMDLAEEMGLSQGEVAKALARLSRSGLIHGKQPNRAAALEFFIHAIKYVFPVELGPLSMGVPTAISAPAHVKMVVQVKDEVYVWPSVNGNKRGQSIVPLYPNLPEAALRDPKFYGLMAAIEILRVGRARERSLAEKYLKKNLESA